MTTTTETTIAQPGQLTTAADQLRFITAARSGRAVVTLESARARYTYRIAPMKDRDTGKREPGRFFVHLLTGPDNRSDFCYLGLLLDNGATFRWTRKSCASPKARSVLALEHLVACLAKGETSPHLRVWHEGRCGSCARPLTVPSSIASGLGPICADRL